MSQPTDFDTLLSDWLADDGPSEVPARVAQGAIAQVRALSPVQAGATTVVHSLHRPFRPARLLALAATLALIGATVAFAFALLRPSPHRHRPPWSMLPANGLIVASEDGDIITFDPTTGAKTVLPDNLGDDTVTTVSPDGRTIAWWSQDGIDQRGRCGSRTWTDADGSGRGSEVEQPGECRPGRPAATSSPSSHAVGSTWALRIMDDREGGELDRTSPTSMRTARPGGRMGRRSRCRCERRWRGARAAVPGREPVDAGDAADHRTRGALFQLGPGVVAGRSCYLSMRPDDVGARR